MDDAMDLAAWLRQLRENHVCIEILLYLTAKDLKELGIVSVGHRRQLLEASADLRPSAKATDERISQFSRSDLTLI